MNVSHTKRHGLGAFRALTGLALLTAVAVGSAQPADSQQSPGDAFNEAKLRELTEGNLKRSLELYDLVIKDARAAATMKAKAYYRLGLCYVKSGRTDEARQAFRRLIKLFPASDEATQAKLLNSGLGLSQAAAAPVRDLTFEAQALLVKASDRKQSREAIKSLVFMGDRALPALRAALRQEDNSIRSAAISVLAKLRPNEALPALVAEAGKSSFTYRYAVQSSRSILEDLIRKRPPFATEVATAYRAASVKSRAKVNLLRALVAVQQFDLLGDYRRHLDGASRSLQGAAWDAWIADSSSRKASIRPILEAIEQRWSDDNVVLASTISQLLRRHRSLADDERATLTALAIRATQTSVQRRIIRGTVSKKKYLLPVIAELMKQTLGSNAGNIIPDSYAGVPQPALRTFGDAIVSIAIARAKRSNQDAARLIRTLDALLSYLDPAGFHALSERLIADPTLLGKEPTLPATAEAVQSLLLNASMARDLSRNPSANWTAEEKHVPLHLAILRRDLSSDFRARALQSLGAIVRSYWSSFSKKARESIKECVLAVERPSAGHWLAHPTTSRSRYLQSWMDLFLLLSRVDGGIDVDTHLRIRALRSGAPKPTGYTDAECIAALNRAVGKPGMPAHTFVRLVDWFVTEPAKRDEMIRKHWPHANELWSELVTRLRPTEGNLDFVLNAMTPEQRRVLPRRCDNWLRSINSPKITPLFVALLDQKSVGAKVAACRLLKSLADPAAAPKLIELLAYRDAKVRSAAEEALRAIRSIKTNQEQWRDWYRTQLAKQKREATKDTTKNAK